MAERRIPGLSSLFALLVKGTKLVKVAKVFKALKLVKVAGTFLSMAISTFVYSFLMGPWFALGFVLLLFAHEMGHVAAMRMRGYPAGAPLFIPMLGAVIFAPEFKSRDDEAFIGIGGPLLGGLASGLLLLWWNLFPSELILRLAYTSAFINLFNLLPIRPLDGGRVLQVVGSWTKYIAIGILGGISFLVREPSISLIWILVLDDIGLRSETRARTAWALWAMMVLAMLTGFSGQSPLLDAWDSLLGMLFCLMYDSRAKWELEKAEMDREIARIKKSYLVHPIDTEEPPPTPDQKEQVQPNLPIRLRFAWAAIYLALANALILTMAGGTPATHRPAMAFALGMAVLVTAARAAVPFYLWHYHNHHFESSKQLAPRELDLAYFARHMALFTLLPTSS